MSNVVICLTKIEGVARAMFETLRAGGEAWRFCILLLRNHYVYGINDILTISAKSFLHEISCAYESKCPRQTIPWAKIRMPSLLTRPGLCFCKKTSAERRRESSIKITLL